MRDQGTQEENRTLLDILHPQDESDHHFGRTHEAGEWSRVRLNVSGTIFETYERTLRQKKDSIFNKGVVRSYYNSHRREYYFDRNPKGDFSFLFLLFLLFSFFYCPTKNVFQRCRIYKKKRRFLLLGTLRKSSPSDHSDPQDNTSAKVRLH